MILSKIGDCFPIPTRELLSREDDKKRNWKRLREREKEWGSYQRRDGRRWLWSRDGSVPRGEDGGITQKGEEKGGESLHHTFF